MREVLFTASVIRSGRNVAAGRDDAATIAACNVARYSKS